MDNKIPKLAWCLIVKPTDREAILLNRNLSYLNGNVDKFFITQAGESINKKVSAVIKKYNGVESFFKWEKDFAKARNFNFNQVTEDYEFIGWNDADDICKGADKLKTLTKTMENGKIDIAVMNYLYDFNEKKECTVKHLKTRVVRRGSVEWVGAVHEDFEQKRELESYFCKDIEILHLTDEKRAGDSIKRNLEIALAEEKRNPNDPRSTWLVANAYWGNGIKDKAIEYFEKFIIESYSDEEKYIANIVLADLKKDELSALRAFSIRPNYPNAYFKLAEIKYDAGKFQTAIELIEIGLQLPIPEMTIMVHNPRDYDYNPLMLMLKCYWKLGKTSKAVEIIGEMAKMFPDDKDVQRKQKLLKEELGELLDADKYLKEAQKIKDKKELKKFLDKLPEKVKSHPQICYFKNQNFVKEKTSGKDLVYYCGYTTKIWNPEIANTKGVGGSEEAVINLSKELAKYGWNVTVYNNCGKGGEWDGVKYRPFWEYNVRDNQDVTILWRSPRSVDYDLKGKVVIDLHDVISNEEFTPERLAKIDKVFVKTEAHKILFPNVEQQVVIPNGIDPTLFKGKVKKNPYLILNTSSPDRHLEATLDIFEELIRREPKKPWKLAWYYGWGVYDDVHEQNNEMKDWKVKQMERFNKLVKEGRAEGGMMIGHKEIAKKYLEAGIFLYPTQFMEIHCISAVKAQLAECMMVTSDFAALKETVKTKCVHTDGKKWETESTFGDTENRDKYVEAIFKWKAGDVSQKVEDEYNWLSVTSQWNNELTNINQSI